MDHSAVSIDRALENWNASESLPGFIAALTDLDGIIYCFSRENDSRVDRLGLDSMFWIASMTKPVTSIAALQMVDAGLATLDDPIGECVPEIDRRLVITEVRADGHFVSRAMKGRITLAQLLSHTAGFSAGGWDARMDSYIRAANIPPIESGKLGSYDLPLLSDPGAHWHYGVSHDWAGLVVERLSGAPLNRYTRENIFNPVGMNDTYYLHDRKLMDRRVPLFSRDGSNGGWAKSNRKAPSCPDFSRGGGGLVSTAKDYLAFIRMLLNGGAVNGKTILSCDLTERIARNATGALSVSRLTSSNCEISNEFELLPGTRKCWGLGFMINLERTPQGRSPGSLAWAGLPNTYFWIDPAAGIGGVFLTQLLPFGDRAALEGFECFESAVYRSLSAGRPA